MCPYFKVEIKFTVFQCILLVCLYTCQNQRHSTSYSGKNMDFRVGLCSHPRLLLPETFGSEPSYNQLLKFFIRKHTHAPE